MSTYEEEKKYSKLKVHPKKRQKGPNVESKVNLAEHTSVCVCSVDTCVQVHLMSLTFWKEAGGFKFFL